MKAIITIGCSASGKSTWAKSKANYVDINRDEFRQRVLVSKHMSPHGVNIWSLWNFKWEKEVNPLIDAEIEACKSRMENIIISDTNLDIARRQALTFQLTSMGWEVEYKVFGEDLTLDELWKRDEKRVNTVGRDVITAQYVKFRKEFPRFQLKEVSTREKAVVFDIDGTLAHMVGRSPYDWSAVESDTPDDVVFGALIAQVILDRKIIVMSGRSDECREQTTNWLNYWFVEYYHRVTECPRSEINQAFFGTSNLFMRASGDQRKDVIIKNELFFEKVDGKYQVIAVFDDRPSVCRGWYDLGLKVIHCANPYLEF